MPLPANGYLEVNGDAVFRGHLLGASGTFSGTWETDVLDVVDYINIKGGAVTSYVVTAPQYNALLTPNYFAEATLPAYPGHVSLISIIAPVNVYSYGAKIRIARNGTLIHESSNTNFCGHTEINQQTQSIQIKEPAVQYIEFIDAYQADAAVTYTMYFEEVDATDVRGTKNTLEFAPYKSNNKEDVKNGVTPVANILFGYRRL